MKTALERLIGEPVFIRTVTMYYVGRLKEVYKNELVLTECSWVADTGRFHNALKDGVFSEVEPFVSEEVIVARGGLIDICQWGHAIPTEQK